MIVGYNIWVSVNGELTKVFFLFLPASKTEILICEEGAPEVCKEIDEQEDIESFRIFILLMTNEMSNKKLLISGISILRSIALSKPFLACDSCRSVQPVDPSVDYFQIFGLEKIYGIDDTHLESKYKNWQKKLHPDLVHSKSEKEKEYAAEQSARVIDAYRTLQKPLLRAMYL
ncbi:Iron-sulfur cluster co-chaperone protein hscb protein, partial [Thalictrum thalictroides]